jgi:protein involved in polysaccharide export with SLBB domain
MVGMLSVVALGQTQSSNLQPSSQQLIDSESIAVVGAVHFPGIYKVEANTTIINVLARSGGTQPYANRKSAQVIRLVKPSTPGNAPEQITIPVDLDAIFKNKAKNISLQVGDTIVIPGVAPRSWPLGDYRF